jgi:hypothetical protein
VDISHDDTFGMRYVHRKVFLYGGLAVLVLLASGMVSLWKGDALVGLACLLVGVMTMYGLFMCRESGRKVDGYVRWFDMRLATFSRLFLNNLMKTPFWFQGIDCLFIRRKDRPLLYVFHHDSGDVRVITWDVGGSMVVHISDPTDRTEALIDRIMLLMDMVEEQWTALRDDGRATATGASTTGPRPTMT